ncbi:MAG: hypothetical protein N3H30_00255 [Candidatus Micrarchaeota archaeon]|nr:hypothetical protein [Candidatus Micrarchaeota archaeon]
MSMLLLTQLHAFNATYLEQRFARPWESFQYLNLPAIEAVVGSEDSSTPPSLAYLSQMSGDRDLAGVISSAKESQEHISKAEAARQRMLHSLRLILSLEDDVDATVILTALVNMPLSMFIIFVGEAIDVTVEGRTVMEQASDYYTHMSIAAENAAEAHNAMLSKVAERQRTLDNMCGGSKYTGVQANRIADLSNSLGTASQKSESLLKTSERLKSIIASLSPESSGSKYSQLSSYFKDYAFGCISGTGSTVSQLYYVYVLQGEVISALEGEYASSRTQSLRALSSAQELSTRLSSEYSGISGADAAYFGVQSFSTDSPAMRIDSAALRIARAQSLLTQADATYASKGRGYVGNAISLHYEALEHLTAASFELEQADKSGRAIEKAASEATLMLLAQAKADASAFVPATEQDASRLEQARTLIDSAEKLIGTGATAGARITNLRKAHMMLTTARTLLSPSYSAKDNAIAMARQSLDYLKNITALARADGVDVSDADSYYKRGMAALSSQNIDAAQAAEISSRALELAELIVSRASAQYSYLWAKYRQLGPAIQEIEAMGGTPPQASPRLQQYISLSGGFDPYRSLGHYKEIASDIAALEGEVRSRARQIVSASLSRNSRTAVLYSGEIYLGQPVQRQVLHSAFSTINPGIELRGITYEVQVPYDLSLSKASAQDGIEHSYSNGRLSVLIPSYTPNKLYTITFTDNRTLATIDSSKTSSSLSSPTLLTIRVERQATAYGVLPHLWVQPRFNRTYTLLYDGEPLGEFYGNARISREILQGKHTITEVYEMQGPVRVYASSVQASGDDVVMDVIVENTAPVAVEGYVAQVELPGRTTSAKASSSDCAASSLSLSSTSQSTSLSFTVSRIQAGSQCRIRVTAKSDLESSRISARISAVNSSALFTSCQEARLHAELSGIQLKSGNLATAYREVTLAEKALADCEAEKRQREQRKEYEEKLKRLLNSTLNGLGNVSDPQVSESLSRIQSYYDSSLNEGDDEKRIRLLEKGRDEAYSLSSEAYSRAYSLSQRLNDVKKGWLELISLGYADSLPPEISQVEAELSSAASSGVPSSETFSALDRISSRIESLELSLSSAKSSSKAAASSFRERFKSAVASLKSARDALVKACGASCPQEMLSEIDRALAQSPQQDSDYPAFTTSIEQLTSSVGSYIRTLREGAVFAISELRSSIAGVQDDARRSQLESKAKDIDRLFEQGRYSSARDAAVGMLEALGSQPSEGQDYTLVLAGIAVIILSFIVIKMREGGKAGSDLQKSLKRAYE